MKEQERAEAIEEQGRTLIDFCSSAAIGVCWSAWTSQIANDIVELHRSIIMCISFSFYLSYIFILVRTVNV